MITTKPTQEVCRHLDRVAFLANDALGRALDNISHLGIDDGMEDYVAEQLARAALCLYQARMLVDAHWSGRKTTVVT